MDDLISRREAIDALDGLCDRACEYSKKQRHVMCDACHLGSAFDVLEQLPTQTNATNTLDCVERQAAIDAVEILLEQTEEDADVKTWNNAIRGAINSIKHHVPSAQPEIRTQMSSANCISRQEAIDILDAFEVKIENGEPFAYSWARMRITELPSAQPERKKGKWVGYDGDWLKTMCKCSECGAMIDINEKYRNFFCYHCGADMREDIDAV